MGKLKLLKLMVINFLQLLKEMQKEKMGKLKLLKIKMLKFLKKAI